MPTQSASTWGAFIVTLPPSLDSARTAKLLTELDNKDGPESNGGECDVRGQQLLDRTMPVFSPDTQKVADRAFDEVWATIAPSVGSDPKAIEDVRLKLARAVLAVTREGDIDAENIKRLAFAIMQLES